MKSRYTRTYVLHLTYDAVCAEDASNSAGDSVCEVSL